jgi:hypothetical protein
VLATLLCAAVLPARAALIELDLDAAGDRALTRNTAQGLDYLDVDRTLGLSYQQIVSGEGGWQARGFRHATVGEALALMTSMGFSDFQANARGDQFLPGLEYGRLFGCTRFCDGPDDRNFYSDAILDSGDIPRGIGMVELVVLTSSGFERARLYLGGPVAGLGANFSDPFVGNLLVRAVPEPGTAGWLIPAMAALVWRRRSLRKV